MDLRSSWGIIRDQRRLLVRVGAVALFLGLVYGVLFPASLASTTLVLLPAPVQEGALLTQVRIVLSTPVLDRAGSSLRPRLHAAEVRSRIDVDAPTIQMIEITAHSPAAAEARAISQSVADSYITALQDNARTVTASSLEGLRTRERDLSTQLKALQTEIDATSARQRGGNPTSYDGRRDAQLLAQLTGEQSGVALALDKVKDDLSTYETFRGVSGAAASVIQPASPPAGAGLIQHLLTCSLVGGIVGILGAAAALLVRTYRDPRVRSRDDLADAVGSGVLAEVRTRPLESIAEWIALFETYEAGPVEEWAFRQVLRTLLHSSVSRPPGGSGVPTPGGQEENHVTGRLEHPVSLTVLSLAEDQRALAVGPQLAVFTASAGIATRLLTSTGQPSSAPLWAACSGGHVSGRRARLEISAQGADPLPSRAGADLTVVLVVVDPAQPTLEGVPPAAATVLAVSPGVARRDELARLAVAVDDVGRRIDGVVVANPDVSDRTTGRRLLDERVRDVPLPVRLTGTGSAAVPTDGLGVSR